MGYLLLLMVASLLAGCASANNVEQRPFFQHEYDLESHGRKTWLDHLVEFDPGGFKVDVKPEYNRHPPARIAVLPFTTMAAPTSWSTKSRYLPQPKAALQLVLDRRSAATPGDAGVSVAARISAGQSVWR